MGFCGPNVIDVELSVAVEIDVSTEVGVVCNMEAVAGCVKLEEVKKGSEEETEVTSRFEDTWEEVAG